MQKQYGWHIKNKVCILNAGIISISFLISYLLVVIIAAPLFTPWQNKITDSFFRLRHAVKGRGEVSPYIIHAVLNDTTYRVLENDWQEADLFPDTLYPGGNRG